VTPEPRVVDPGLVDAGDGLDAVTVAGLAELARRGSGIVLGIAPAARSGIKRVARPPGPEFRSRLEASFRHRYPALVRYAFAKVGDRARAEDVVQQAFEKVWRGYRREPREIHNLDAYVYTAVASEINNDLRRVVTKGTDSPLDVAEHVADDRKDVQARVTDVVAINAALALLTPREREAIVLRGQYDLTVAEAAEIMKLSQGAVKRYTADATRKLRATLAA
jgi:RNA polymerase sigma-70 factor (ECF subfamily)